jgi:integrase
MLTTSKRIAYPSFRPYIFSKQEVAAILQEARKLSSYPQFPLRPQTCCMIITLLYALGLRLGEVCRVHINDVDLDQATLFIRDTKFHKNRTVPFGPRLNKHLEEYLDVRRTVFPPLRADDSLFVALQRRSVGPNTIEHTFRKLIKKASIAASPGRRQPRLHDLRHTFAVQRLLRWYREGAEVQSKLPLLSTFMGHIDLKSTQFYLDITGDLLEEANTRFFRRFGSSFHEEVR